MHWLLRYTTAPDYLERRGTYRDAHLALAWTSVAAGLLIAIFGALSLAKRTAWFAQWANCVLGLALLLVASEVAARAFAKADPYVANGLVTRWDVQPWNTVVGNGAANPVRPAA